MKIISTFTQNFYFMEKKQEENPPIMGTWNRLYALVLGINFILFLLFTYLTFKFK
jgi:hypothetical protein